MRAILILAGGSLFLAGCGAATPVPGCADSLALVVLPTTAVATHNTTAPNNQAQFTAGLTPTASSGCPVPAYAIVAYPAWTNPDPLDISITNGTTSGTSNGLATCNAATSGPVTLTATTGTGASQQTKTVQLTCN